MTDVEVSLGEVYRMVLQIDRKLDSKVNTDVYIIGQTSLDQRVTALEKGEDSRQERSFATGVAILVALIGAIASLTATTLGFILK